MVALFCASLVAGRHGLASEPKSVTDYDEIVSPSDRQHWSFKPVHGPAVPQVRDTGGFAIRSINHSSAAREKGWRPADAAKPQALLRRMFLDITGLPPTL